MSSEPIKLTDNQINKLKVFFKKIGIPTTEISKTLKIEDVSKRISNIYEKTISPGQIEAVMRRVMGIPLTPKQRTQLYDLRKKIYRYEKFLASFREWGRLYDYQFKIIILGLTEDQSEYISQIFDKPFIASERDIIGVKFLTKLTETFSKTLTRLQIWDVTSQKRFAFLRPQFYRGAASAILVFNKESRESFDMIKKYCNELKESTDLKFKLKIKRKFKKEIPMPIGLIATGINTVIPYEEILSLTNEIGASYYEMENIKDERFQQIFEGIAMALLIRLQGNS
ncbi:MAG: hypothetical protein EAX91_18420 [Candidatus Lokiarchaeota archaeon]|nr:hypothetical protein [Candidatus Lokiarchaeota archaeon]